jgi:hypothetical protein
MTVIATPPLIFLGRGGKDNLYVYFVFFFKLIIYAKIEKKLKLIHYFILKLYKHKIHI